MSSPVYLASPEAQQLIRKHAAASNLPSPPLSVSDDGHLLDFDASDLSFDVGATPESTALVSPKSSTISPVHAVGPSFTFEPLAPCVPQISPISSTPTQGTGSTAEALSQHHLERYLHYKALAAQATADANLASLQLININAGVMTVPDMNNNDMMKQNMLALQAQSGQPTYADGNVGQQQQHSFWNTTLQIQQRAHQQAINAHAAANAHLQAHANANANAAQHNLSMGTYYMTPTHLQQPLSAGAMAQPMAQPPSLWSRESVSTSVSGGSPPYLSTPIYPSNGLALPTITGDDDMEEDELVSDGKMSSSTSVTNLHGGGRGYVPGKTPDDPRKRHKCNVCGRGFARAFNLKSHMHTHDPGRPKPHQCPHSMCKRSFSRLHDLERHRQGIHSDGPLVDAKRQGVSPSVVRAQSRMRSRAESGGLI
ncbi:uncharacterized protein CcaverHIS019_0303300 [Cutaneotrichosporon cavernicola]|uniref:C2H2-type domain-containing protein n=1 Tax=Cutaneotrichosporon cavernicola TaxID=279322 RepID=A0AA48L1V1_9TREE|nr:uncharacterized protein CcaverHIS019_0303300 [Cutaneotrichosporon cavernicola]BEI90260.1 hypothetical protein CcaverHIS019_0303300 [Cutaneotrichosporon cavernicola]